MVNVTIYGIHGSYGLVLLIFGVQIFPWCCMKLHDSPVPAASGIFGAALVFQPRPFSVQILWIKFIGPLGPKNWPARVSLYMSYCIIYLFCMVEKITVVKTVFQPIISWAALPKQSFPILRAHHRTQVEQLKDPAVWNELARAKCEDQGYSYPGTMSSAQT